jgi:hypothetical protein
MTRLPAGVRRGPGDDPFGRRDRNDDLHAAAAATAFAQIDRRVEALDHCHRTGLERAADTEPPRPLPKPRRDGADELAQHHARQSWVERQAWREGHGVRSTPIGAQARAGSLDPRGRPRSHTSSVRGSSRRSRVSCMKKPQDGTTRTPCISPRSNRRPRFHTVSTPPPLRSRTRGAPVVRRRSRARRGTSSSEPAPSCRGRSPRAGGVRRIAIRRRGPCVGQRWPRRAPPLAR